MSKIEKVISDIELEIKFREQFHNGMLNIVDSNVDQILSDLKDRKKNTGDGTLKVTFTASLELFLNNEVTIDIGEKYDMKTTRKDALPQIKITSDDQPDMFEEEEEEAEEVEDVSGDDTISPE
jgi:hypothetical protein